MEYRIAHACGHEQAHYLSGFASQMDRKAAWLKTTKCKICFVAEKRAEQADAASNAGAAIAHLDLPPLSGSERQIEWALTIRAKRLAAIIATSMSDGAADHEPCLGITDAKWWIDCRDLTDADLIAKAAIAAASREAAAPMMIMVQSVGIA